MSENKSGFSVLDMATQYAENNDMSVDDLFMKKEQPTPPTTPEESDEMTPISRKKPSSDEPWTPDEELLEGMDELTAGPVVYAKDEIKYEEDRRLQNGKDEEDKINGAKAVDSLGRIDDNINEARERHGIKHFKIPQGPYQVRMTAAAGDTDHKRAQAHLDEVIAEIATTYPEWIEYYPTEVEEAPAEETNGFYDNKFIRDTIIDNELQRRLKDPVYAHINVPQEHIDNMRAEIAAEYDAGNRFGADQPAELDGEQTYHDNVVKMQPKEDSVKVNIDKTNLPQISWTPEDLDKIRKSRTIELNIVERLDLDYSQIEDVEPNAIDTVLAPYQRQVNDVTAALPASKYRATFTGLTYTEVMDLNNSVEMNNIDGERKKWSICFDHIKNQSIGPWEEYQWYIDPDTKQKVRIGFTDTPPANINPDDVHVVTKFIDFLMKTSFMDLEFMLWKILCATTMDKEIISIDCNAIFKGQRCGNNYDWVYSPTELLQMDSINPAVLEEMKQTGEVTGKEEIMANYNSSMLRLNNAAELKSSGFTVVFGHISAFDYLDSVYAEIEALQEMSANDPMIASRTYIFVLLTIVKAFLIPKEDGGWSRVTGVKNLIKVIDSLNEIDWQILSELAKIMVEPYQFTYMLKDIVCPNCKNRSSITIDSMTKLLFIVARSLDSVNVILKRQ